MCGRHATSSWTGEQGCNQFVCNQRENAELAVHALENCITSVEPMEKVTESVWGGPFIPAKMKGKPTEQQEKARQAHLSGLFLKELNRRRKLIGDITFFINLECLKRKLFRFITKRNFRFFWFGRRSACATATFRICVGHGNS